MGMIPPRLFVLGIAPPNTFCPAGCFCRNIDIFRLEKKYLEFLFNSQSIYLLQEFHLRCICHFWRDSAKFVHPGKETFISLAHIPLNQKHNHFALFVFDIWSKLIKKFVEIIHKGHPQEYLPQCFCAFSHDMLGTEFKNLFKSNPVNLLFKVLSWDAFLPLLNQ